MRGASIPNRGDYAKGTHENAVDGHQERTPAGGRVLQAISASSATCSGSRSTNTQYGTLNESACCNMVMLAGVTAMVSANKPMPAAVRVDAIKRPAAPSSSNKPLIRTAPRGQGMYGGTMRISRSVNAKCAMPPTKTHKNTNPRANRYIAGYTRRT